MRVQSMLQRVYLCMPFLSGFACVLSGSRAHVAKPRWLALCIGRTEREHHSTHPQCILKVGKY